MTNDFTMRSVILASASPQRARLLEQLGMAFTPIAADIDETPRRDETAEALVGRLAVGKAEALSIAYPEALIIGSDTEVALGERIYGKPADTDDAAAMLASLAGRTHRVVSGVAVCVDGVTRVRTCVSEVTMRAIDTEEIAAYGRCGEPLGKAGGYAIQGRGALFVEYLAGSYSAVMGLPLFDTGLLLRQAGIEVL